MPEILSAQSKYVVEYLNLAVAMGACANADSGATDRLGNLFGKFDRNEFENHRENAQTIEFFRRIQNGFACFSFSLNLKTSELMDRLGGQSDMAHHGDSRPKNGFDGLPSRAFGLYCRCPRFDERHRRIHRLSRRRLVAPKRQVGDNQSTFDGPRNGSRVVDDVFKVDRKRRFIAQNDVAEAVANEDHVDSGGIGDKAGRIVVSGHANRFLALSLKGAYSRSCHLLRHRREFTEGPKWGMSAIPKGTRDLVLFGLEATPDTLKLFLEKYSDSVEWDDRPDPERFTAREHLAHLSDWEEVFQRRFEQTLANGVEDLFNPDPWTLKETNSYSRSDRTQSVARFADLRKTSIKTLDALSERDWQELATHSSHGPMTLEIQAVHMLAHDGYHIRQLFTLLAP